MLGSYRFAFLALIAAALLLIGCATDPITDSLRPTPEDVANHPGAPAGSVAALIRVGEATRQSGDPVTAITLFRRAHNLDPFKAEPLVKLGDALNDVGKFGEAADAFRSALEYEHNNVEALRGLGTALIGLNQPGLAIDHFKAALAIEPDYRSYNGLGVASDHMGQHKIAQDYYESGLKIYPKNLTLLNNLGLSQLLSRDYDAAVVTLVTASEQPGATARQRLNLALAYGLAGRDAEAQRIARIDLDDKTVQDNLAYYGILRAADDAALLSAILGVHVPVPPPSTASQPDIAPASIQPKAGGESSVEAPVKPQAADNPPTTPEVGPGIGAVSKTAAEPAAASSRSNKEITAATPAPTTESVQPTSRLEIKPVMRASILPVDSKPVSGKPTKAAITASPKAVAQIEAVPAPSDSAQRNLQASSARIAAPTAAVPVAAAEKPITSSVVASSNSNSNDSKPVSEAVQVPAQTSSPPPDSKVQQTAMVPNVDYVPNQRSGGRFKQDSAAGPGAWYVQQAATDSDADTADKWKPVTSFFDHVWGYFFKPLPATATASADVGSSATGAAVSQIAPAAGSGTMTPPRVNDIPISDNGIQYRSRVNSEREAPGARPESN